MTLRNRLSIIRIACERNSHPSTGPFSMEYHVAQLLKEPIGAMREFEIDQLADNPAEAGWEWVRGPVKLTRTRTGILAQAPLVAAVPDICSRCLADYVGALDVPIETEFYPTVDIVTGGPVTAPADEADGFPISGNHILDLSDAVREGVLLARSLAPLCRPDCAGLCPRCGQDLNQGPCDCREEPADPRWARLAELSESLGPTHDVKEG